MESVTYGAGAGQNFGNRNTSEDGALGLSLSKALAAGFEGVFGNPAP
jgi:hypothetical protein